MSKKIKRKLPSLTIAIPAYNEEQNLEWVIKDTLRQASNYLSDFEILIIDDGSTDATGKIADDMAKKNRKVKVIHKKNSGYGETMLFGIKNAKKEFVCYMPADGQFIVDDMRHCFSRMPGSDLIFGYRGKRLDYTIYRLILSYGYLFLLRLLFGMKYRDVNWLNIWRTKLVQKINISSRSVFILAEIGIRFKRKGFRIVEAPSFYRVRRGGKVKNAKPSVAFRALVDMLKFFSKTNE